MGMAFAQRELRVPVNFHNLELKGLQVLVHIFAG
jgi:hypothetical protein